MNRKVIALVAVFGVALLVFYPPAIGKSQDTVIVQFKEPVLSDTTNLSPLGKMLYDSLVNRQAENRKNLDTVANVINTAVAQRNNVRFRVTEYRPPVSVLRLRFKGRTEDVSVDSSGLLVTERVIYDK